MDADGKPDQRGSLHKELEGPGPHFFAFLKPVPEADQALSCRVALVGGHLRKEGLHVLDPLKGSFDTGTKLVLYEDCGELAQLEIPREMITTVPW